METYSKFRPTGFDPAGAFLNDDRQNWLVVPVSQTRDSGPLDQSNFDVALSMLGGEGDTVEVHRFGHWGPGWFEIIIVEPGTPAAKIAEEIENSLAHYPILDESDFCEREFNDYQESWDNWARYDFCYEIAGKFNLSDSAQDILGDADSAKVMEFFESLNPGRDYYWSEDSGVCVNIKGSVDNCTRQQIAAFIRANRTAASGEGE